MTVSIKGWSFLLLTSDFEHYAASDELYQIQQSKVLNCLTKLKNNNEIKIVLHDPNLNFKRYESLPLLQIDNYLTATYKFRQKVIVRTLSSGSEPHYSFDKWDDYGVKFTKYKLLYV